MTFKKSEKCLIRTAIKGLSLTALMASSLIVQVSFAASDINDTTSPSGMTQYSNMPTSGTRVVVSVETSGTSSTKGAATAPIVEGNLTPYTSDPAPSMAQAKPQLSSFGVYTSEKVAQTANVNGVSVVAAQASSDPRVITLTNQPGLSSPSYIGTQANQQFTLFDKKRMPYEGAIYRAARETNVEPALIRAVITAESGFNPYQRSRKGAVGLMQLLPSTARRFGVRHVWNPEENIRAGARYLSFLLRTFNNNVKLAVAAYNAGEGSVIRYGNRVPPFRETKYYVPKVLAYYQQYLLATPSAF